MPLLFDAPIGDPSYIYLKYAAESNRSANALVMPQIMVGFLEPKSNFHPKISGHWIKYII